MTAVMALDVHHEVLAGQHVRVQLQVDLDELTPELRRWVTQIFTAATVPYPDVAHAPGRAEGQTLVPSPAPVDDDPIPVVDQAPALPDPSPEVAAADHGSPVGTATSGPTEGATRDRILAVLADGPVEDPSGLATAELVARAGLTIARTRINVVIRQLEADGRIVVTRPNSRRVTRIALTGWAPTVEAVEALPPDPLYDLLAEDVDQQAEPVELGPHPGGDRLDFSCFHGEHDACHRRRRPCSCPCHVVKDRAA